MNIECLGKEYAEEMLVWALVGMAIVAINLRFAHWLGIKLK